MAMFVDATSYGYEAGSFIASNQYAVGQPLIFYQLTVAPSDPVLSVVHEIELAEDAEVDRATFGITASPAGVASLDGIADVRSAQAQSSSAVSAHVIDFGRMVTVSQVAGPSIPSNVLRWSGSRFDTIAGYKASSGSFPDQVTERLLVEFSTNVSESTFRSQGTARLPATPTGLELLVDGTTVWSERQGGSAGLTPPSATGGVGYAVDRSDAVREAFLRRPGGPVRLELRAATPGRLTLEPLVGHRRSHRVAFPEGEAKSLTLGDEGSFTVDLSLPEESSGWQVEQVRMTVRAGAGPDRVQPPDGPAFALDDARLVLAPGHPLVARLPAPLVDRFALLTGVRLALLAPTRDGEVSGRLLADRAGGGAGGPGEPIEGGAARPMPVRRSATPVWVTLPLAAPLPATSPLWLELQATYGEVEWALTASGPSDPATPGAELFRLLPGGGYRPYPVLDELGVLSGSVRLVGRAASNRPIPMLLVDVGSGEPVAVTGADVDGAVRIGLPEPVVPVGGTLTVDAVAAAGGSVALRDVRVVYREPAA